MTTALATSRRFTVTLTLKSGVQLRAECDHFKVQRNGFGDMLALEWENLSTQWLHVDLAEVAAIECERISGGAS